MGVLAGDSARPTRARGARLPRTRRSMPVPAPQYSRGDRANPPRRRRKWCPELIGL